MLRFARECLEPGGKLMVGTGSRILVPFKKPLSTYFSTNPADTHCFRWSAQTLCYALLIAGFGQLCKNDYIQSDWLVRIATPGTGMALPDNPLKIIDYFKRWDREFP